MGDGVEDENGAWYLIQEPSSQILQHIPLLSLQVPPVKGGKNENISIQSKTKSITTQ